MLKKFFLGAGKVIVGTVIGLIVLGIVITAIGYFATGNSGSSGIYTFFLLLLFIGMIGSQFRTERLQKKFLKLGNMTGKTMTEITQVVGQPTSRSVIGSGVLLQWQADGYHIAINFDGKGLFSGITHESSV